MSTALKTEEEKKEYFDSPEELDRKVGILADWVKKSNHFIAFTGAGISTSTGIPDFRSGTNTVLPTGPGAWEKLATGSKGGNYRKIALSATPSPSHMSLVELASTGMLKFLISQNTDGMHRKSGFPVTKLAELHGNSNLEICKNKNCGKQFLRDFRTRTAVDVHDHETERACENCGQKLYDTIINFGESLPKRELTNGFYHGRKADLCLCLGSSLRVTPAADMPVETVKNGGKLVIVNLQATPLDKYALRINGFIDDVMTRLMAKLGLTNPPFILQRRMMISKFDTIGGKAGLTLRGCDEVGCPYTLFKKVECTIPASKESFSSTKEPFVFTPKTSDLNQGIANVILTFQGHYAEPDLNVEVPLDKFKKGETIYYKMDYDPAQRKWIYVGQTTINQ